MTGPVTPPTLRTPRLVLAPHAPADLPDVAALWADPRTTEHLGARPFTREESWRNIQRYLGHWTIRPYGYLTVRDAATGAFLGEVGLMDSRRDTTPDFEGTPEAGWAFTPASGGKGYAREAAAALLSWADRAGVGRTVCMIAPANTPSLRLAEALGYRAAGEVEYRGEVLRLFGREAGPTRAGNP